MKNNKFFNDNMFTAENIGMAMAKIAEDEYEPITRTTAKNRRNRRLDEKSKRKDREKHTDLAERRLGRMWRYSKNVQVDAYYKDEDGKKVKVFHGYDREEMPALGEVIAERDHIPMDKVKASKVADNGEKDIAAKHRAKVFEARDERNDRAKHVEPFFSHLENVPEERWWYGRAGETVWSLEIGEDGSHNWEELCHRNLCFDDKFFDDKLWPCYRAIHEYRRNLIKERMDVSAKLKDIEERYSELLDRAKNLSAEIKRISE